MEDYLKAMIESAEAGEPVDWSLVYKVMDDAFRREAEFSRTEAEPTPERVHEGGYYDSFYATL